MELIIAFAGGFFGVVTCIAAPVAWRTMRARLAARRALALDRNPFNPRGHGFNLTAQGNLLRTDYRRAVRLARAAGVPVPERPSASEPTVVLYEHVREEDEGPVIAEANNYAVREVRLDGGAENTVRLQSQ